MEEVKSDEESDEKSVEMEEEESDSDASNDVAIFKLQPSSHLQNRWLLAVWQIIVLLMSSHDETQGQTEQKTGRQGRERGSATKLIFFPARSEISQSPSWSGISLYIVCSVQHLIGMSTLERD